MDRARRAAAPGRRRPLAGSASPQPAPELPDDAVAPSVSPVAASGTNVSTPPAAPPGKRGSRAQLFPFSSPGSSRSATAQVLKRQSRTMDGIGFADDANDGSPNKGGHSLRRRARVDYTLEHIDDDPNSPARAKRRAPDCADAPDDLANHPAANGPAAAGLRRNPARKSAENRVYREDDDVQDTIEVGLSPPGSDESEHPQPSRSDASSPARPPALNVGFFAATAAVTAIDSDNAFFGANGVKGSPAPAQSPPGEPPASRADDSPSGPAVPVLEPAQSLHTKDGSVLPLSAKLASHPTAHETLQTVPAEQSTQAVARPALDGSLAQASEMNQDSPEDDEGQPSLQLLEENNKSADKHDSTPATAAGAVDHGHQQQTAETSSHHAPPEQAKADQEREAQGSPQKTAETGSIESAAEKFSDKQPLSQTPSTAITEAAQPSSAAMSDASSETHTQPVSDFVDSQSHGQHDAQATPDATAQASQASQASQAAPEAAPKASRMAKPPPDKAAPGADQTSRLDPEQLWARLTPYVDGEHVVFAGKVVKPGNGEAGQAQTPKDQGANTTQAAVGKDAGDAAAQALDAVGDSAGPTAVNSPTAAEEDDGPEDRPEKPRIYKFRKIRSPEHFLGALQNHRDMPTDKLYKLVQATHAALQEWQHEWVKEMAMIDEWENAKRRREAEQKYETKTRDLNRPRVDYTEPDIPILNNRAMRDNHRDVGDKERKERAKQDNDPEQAYLRSQDMIAAASYGFEFDYNRPGRQYPPNQPIEIQDNNDSSERRRLRSQPKQTKKATQADEVTGKRQRRPPQQFDPAPQRPGRNAGLAPPWAAQGQKRRNARAGEDEHFRKRAKPGRRPAPTPDFEMVPLPPIGTPLSMGKRRRDAGDATPAAEAGGQAGRGRAKKGRQEVVDLEDDEDTLAAEPQPPRKSHVLTLKIPKNRGPSEPPSAITDNGESRPSSAGAASDVTSNTAESIYSFRPKRQKRFRDEPDDGEVVELPSPPRKKTKRAQESAARDVAAGEARAAAAAVAAAPRAAPVPADRKISKIKIVSKSAAGRNGTPASQPAGEGEDRPKDYKSMTKSEKMSASMKSRWANGNMAGAVEKRKATLAAKKAAQAAADQKVGAIAPKPKAKGIKKEPGSQAKLLLQQLAASSQPGAPGTGIPKTE